MNDSMRTRIIWGLTGPGQPISIKEAGTLQVEGVCLLCFKVEPWVGKGEIRPYVLETVGSKKIRSSLWVSSALYADRKQTHKRVSDDG